MSHETVRNIFSCNLWLAYFHPLKMFRKIGKFLSKKILARCQITSTICLHFCCIWERSSKINLSTNTCQRTAHGRVAIFSSAYIFEWESSDKLHGTQILVSHDVDGKKLSEKLIALAQFRFGFHRQRLLRFVRCLIFFFRVLNWPIIGS